ncbi:MAG: hypothetical protein V2A79_13130 [Planctomycetota bacterium]
MMTKSSEQLSCLSIILCDDVFEDKRTSKRILVGTFDRILAGAFPCAHGSMVVWLELTSGRGQYDLSVSIVHAETDLKTLEVNGRVVFEDPLQVVGIAIGFANVVFKEPGKYWIDVYANQTLIAQRAFLVEQPPGTGKSP